MRCASKCCGGAVVLALFVPVAAAGEKTVFRWHDDAEKGQADLSFGAEPVLRYHYAYDPSTPERLQETYKPFHHVFAPKTGERLTKGPGGLYPHHRGLYVGWRATRFDNQSLDFWHCTKGAHQRHIRFLAREGDAERGTMTAEIHWNDAAGQPVVREERTVSVRRAEQPDAWQIDWHSVLSSARGEVQLDGDRQHAGFQYRADQLVAEKNSARFLRPEGFPQQPEAVQVGDQGNPPAHINLGWCAMTYPLSQGRYTVEYFEDPELPKPSLFSERPYGRFGAFFRATLTPAQPLTLRYRLIVSTGDPPAREDIQKRYEVFTAEWKRK